MSSGIRLRFLARSHSGPNSETPISQAEPFILFPQIAITPEEGKLTIMQLRQHSSIHMAGGNKKADSGILSTILARRHKRGANIGPSSLKEIKSGNLLDILNVDRQVFGIQRPGDFHVLTDELAYFFRVDQLIVSLVCLVGEDIYVPLFRYCPNGICQIVPP